MKSSLLFLLAVVLCTATAFGTAPQQMAKTMGKERGTVGALILNPAGVSGTDIFVEGFNDTSASGFPPPGWLMINGDGNTSPDDTAWYQSFTTGGTGTLPPYEGPAFAAAYFGTANGFYLDDYLITPNTGGTAPGSQDSLTFWLTARLSSSGNYADSLDIRVSTTGTNASDFTLRLGYVLAPKAVWTRFAYALPLTPARYIAFRYLMYDGGPSGTNSDKVCLDDVRVSRYPSTAAGEERGMPARFALKQNYPNPFNPATTINFDLAHAAFTTLRVFNLLGQEVATLVNGQLPPGTHTATFSAGNLPNGVYFYRLTSGQLTTTRQMLLVK
ncbi:MAG: choice-of-anchor J domain-containing protein [Bacteroidota bacterium]